MIYTVKGLPPCGERIETPNMAYLLNMPMFSRAPIDVVREHGSDFQRKLLDAVPLKGGYKTVFVDSYVQFLSQKTCSINIRYGRGWLHEWHTDGALNIFDEPSTFHIFTSKSSSRTVFNKHPFELELDNITSREFCIMANENLKKWGIVAESMPYERFVTFTDHLHSSCVPKTVEFRFFFRVTESDVIDCNPDYESSATDYVPVTYFDASGKPVKLDSVVRKSDKIILNLPFGLR